MACFSTLRSRVGADSGADLVSAWAGEKSFMTGDGMLQQKKTGAGITPPPSRIIEITSIKLG